MDASLWPARQTRNAILLDALERAIASGLYLFLTARIVTTSFATHDPLGLLLLPSEGLIVLFLLLRKRSPNISLRLRDWAIAFLGTTLPLLVQPGGGALLAPTALCGLLMLTGIVLQVAAKLTLRRKFGLVAANRGVVVGGPYRLLRHPMYAGYLLTHIGFFLGHATPVNGLIYLVEFMLQVGRIQAEERLLTDDPDYAAFRGRVRFRLIPGIF
jgi:protein-S-isoprenylcysteine O-methyltransferase Ste14